ncbi:MAG TPA: methyltransferase C-terminal domain-containing protein, partial [Candidatus Limnocylindrales bacterium]
LSHAVRPVRLLAACRDVLAHGGRVVLEFHHAQSIVSGGQFDVLGHAHLTYWSLAALESAASGQGLVMLDAYRVPIHGGSIVATLGRSDDTRPRPSRRLQALIDEERAAGLGSADDLGRVAEHASRVRSGLTAFVAEMRATGRTLAGYGAPARGTTLLNYCGLTSADVPFTVDRSPAKQGYLLPGCRIPVRPVEALEAARPNVVLVLPWPLADEIVEQNAIVRSWAGEFVAAMPSLHRIS